MKKKQKKPKYIDDGHTIYNMDVDGMPHRPRKKKESDIELTKGEKKALTKAAFAQYLPIFIITIVGFLLAMVLIYFWLK